MIDSIYQNGHIVGVIRQSRKSYMTRQVHIFTKAFTNITVGIVTMLSLVYWKRQKDGAIFLEVIRFT